MIIEAFTWAFSRAVKGARQAGLVQEVAAIAGKYQRNKKAWQPHLEQTRAAINAAIKEADPAEPILILGSGLGLDLPLQTLNDHPTGALLFDAVKPPQLAAKLKQYPNIKFELRDVTGLLEELCSNFSSKKISLPTSAPLPLKGFSLAISVNMLSQIPLSFSNSPPEGDAEIRMMTAIQKAHIMTLKAMGFTILLISDYERHEYKDDGIEVITTVAYPLWPGKPVNEWDWHITPSGESRNGQTTILKVGVWKIPAELAMALNESTTQGSQSSSII
ncbi:hypothetical protein [Endozoicomonas sp. ALC020]|uniref:hypothetical protein n=1 Tax=unclassified Endozoicomonas TaxID=2644528 RepID=UPI003BAF79CC